MTDQTPLEPALATPSGRASPVMLPISSPDWPARVAEADMPWVRVIEGRSWFETEDGRPWHPIGHNDAVSWPPLRPLFRRADPDAAERYIAMLAAHGVTCLRLMLEYAQHREHYLEKRFGVPDPDMVLFFDDLFTLCERHGLRLLLTPFDTYWTWVRWASHPYNRKKGGPLDSPARMLLCPEARRGIKDRLAFAVRRWSASGALFGWDLWNEIHPAQASESADCFMEFIQDLSDHVRGLETELHGRAHPQTVSLFGPELRWRAHMPLTEPIYRHPALDMASIHIYETGAIDDPRDTVACARAMGGHVAASVAEIRDGRPFFDSEHGPIHSYKDRRRTLPQPFDDACFRHTQWAHLASGGAGGGMRWPNRNPHRLTHGMHRAQRALADFLPLIDWHAFERRSAAGRIALVEHGRLVSERIVLRFATADARQGVIYLLRGRGANGHDGLFKPDLAPIAPELSLSAMAPGRYRVAYWDTLNGRPFAPEVHSVAAENGALTLRLPAFRHDLALAIRPA